MKTNVQTDTYDVMLYLVDYGVIVNISYITPDQLSHYAVYNVATTALSFVQIAQFYTILLT